MNIFMQLVHLEFVANGILEELLTTLSNSKYHLGVSDRFSKLVCTVLLVVLAVECILNVFGAYRVSVYGSPFLFLSDFAM